MEYGNIKYAWFFILLLMIILFVGLGIRKKMEIKTKLGLSLHKNREFFSLFGMSLGIFLIIFSLTQPRILRDYEKVEVKGLDIYVLIDVSKSMLVEDVVPSRMFKAKESIAKILDNLKGDRIGFIPFSGSAYIQMPLTDDYSMASMFLDVLDTDLISGGGTNIEAALRLADKSFDNSGSSEKVVLVISDGDEHDNNSIEFIKNKKEKLKVYSLGIGTTDGGLIPNVVQGENRGFIKDENGNTVIAKLNMGTLDKLSTIGNGESYFSDNFNEGIDKFIFDIANLKRDVNREEKIKKYRELYQYFLFLGVALFLISYFIAQSKKKEEL